MDGIGTDPGVRAVVARRRKYAHAIGAAFAVLAVALLVVVVAVSPATFARALGLATEVSAEVSGVGPTGHGDEDDGTSRWEVTVRWTDPADGGPREARSRLDVPVGTTGVRTRDSVFVLPGFGRDVAFDDEAPAGIWAGLGGAVVAGIAAVLMFRRARPWRELLDRADELTMTRARVTEFTAAVGQTQWWPLVDWTPADGPGRGGVFRLYPQPPFVYPRVGEELELWTLPDGRRRQLLMRRVGDGVWWGGLDRLHLEPVDP